MNDIDFGLEALRAYWNMVSKSACLSGSIRGLAFDELWEDAVVDLSNLLIPALEIARKYGKEGGKK